LGSWAFREVFYPFSGPGGYLSPTGRLCGFTLSSSALHRATCGNVWCAHTEVPSPLPLLQHQQQSKAPSVKSLGQLSMAGQPPFSHAAAQCTPSLPTPHSPSQIVTCLGSLSTAIPCIFVALRHRFFTSCPQLTFE
jgi:hypothetical protein